MAHVAFPHISQTPFAHFDTSGDIYQIRHAIQGIAATVLPHIASNKWPLSERFYDSLLEASYHVRCSAIMGSYVFSEATHTETVRTILTTCLATSDIVRITAAYLRHTTKQIQTLLSRVEYAGDEEEVSVPPSSPLPNQLRPTVEIFATVMQETASVVQEISLLTTDENLGMFMDTCHDPQEYGAMLKALSYGNNCLDIVECIEASANIAYFSPSNFKGILEAYHHLLCYVKDVPLVWAGSVLNFGEQTLSFSEGWQNKMACLHQQMDSCVQGVTLLSQQM